MERFCESCGMPLGGPGAEENAGKYCKYCSDPATGKLLGFEQVRAGTAAWLESFAPEKEGVDFLERAASYLRAMPAWAED